MSLPEFEAVLKEVVNAKRLSASKMTSLTDITMKNMEHDTQLVSILYRTHKSLPSASSKISSLYVFDALSRAAKHHAAKHGLTGDAYTHPGNSASFLFKVGGVVEGLFQDMVTHGSTETKEKTKKILDIWVKGSTFPPEVLSQLASILKGSQQESASQNPTPPANAPQAQPAPVVQPAIPAVLSPPAVDPRISAQVAYPSFQPPAAPTPPAPIADPQAALLALLAQAAANNNIPPLQSNATPQAAVPQLAVLQQLAHTAVSVPSVPQFLPPADRVNIQNTPSSSGVNGRAHSPPSYRNEPRIMVKSEQRYNGYRSPESEPRPETRFDERDNMRGRPPRGGGGGYRGRGRGDRGYGRNWDQRDRDYYRHSERDQSPPPRGGRGGRSRSRSPPSRYRDGKGSRFASPPRRSSAASPPAWRPNNPPARPAPEPGKDEFGRDIRPESPRSPPVTTTKEPSVQPDPPKSPVQPVQTPTDPRPPLAATSTNHEAISSSTTPVQPNIPPVKPNAPISNVADKQAGMESFNIATFDLTSPASWEALGKMWHVTNGYLPSTEELMTFVMPLFAANGGPNGHATPAAGAGMNNHGAQTGTFSAERGRGFGRGRGTFGRGRGGAAYGQNHGRQGDAAWGHNDYGQTDAVVLGGGNTGSNEKTQMQAGSTTFVQGPTLAATHEQGSSGQGTGGRMQRVGDKWVFVRGTPAESS